MSQKFKPSDLTSEAKVIIDTWSATPNLTFGELSLEKLKTVRDTVDATAAAVAEKRVELRGLMAARDDAMAQLREHNCRARGGLKAVFGPDAAQVKQIGWVRASERKTPRPLAAGEEPSAISFQPSGSDSSQSILPQESARGA